MTAPPVSERLARISAYAGATPIAQWLGFSAAADGDDIVYRLAFNETHIGNPAIRAIHGGVIASFLEFAMQADYVASGKAKPAAVNLSIDYLLSSRADSMIARVTRLREGRRLSFLEASGWQEGRLVATARGCFRGV